MNRRQFSAAGALGLAGAWMPWARASARSGFPDRPLTVVVPYPAGGITDIYVRAVTNELGRELGQPVVVDNRTGADGRIGVDRVMHAPADGYTLLAATPLLAVGHSLGSDFRFKPSDFAGVGAIASQPAIVLAANDLPVKTLAELVAYAKDRPGRLNVPHPGRGSSIQLAQELFFQAAGITVNDVPYKGQPPALNDLAAGNLSFAMIHQAMALPMIQAGRVKALATNAGNRTRSLPDVPTVVEAGYPSILVRSWCGLVAAAATPAAVIERLSAAMRAAMASPSVRDRLGGTDSEIMDMSGGRFLEMIEEDSVRFGRLIRERKLGV